MSQPIREIADERELFARLTHPYSQDVLCASRLEGDVMVLGAAGKMGPTLVARITESMRLAQKPNRVFAVSRFSDPQARQQIEKSGAEIIEADLMKPSVLESLPDVANVIYLVAMKFGSSGQQPLTWALNSYLPGRAAQRFANSRIVALSTGNVYGEVDVESGGSQETDTPLPLGEYAQSCLGRERLFQHFSNVNGTPTCLIRLNYAVETRYGVLLDIAQRVYQRRTVPLSMGYANVIWQGDANSVCFRALEHCSTPAAIFNVSGDQRLSVRSLAHQFGGLFGIEPVFDGRERETALLTNASLSHEVFGHPSIAPELIVHWVADWVKNERETHNKPTKFENHDGNF